METSKPTAYVAGPLFLDVVFGGLRHAPRPGEEQWVDELAVVPGGVANQASALARLGVETSLITAIGVDDVGGLVRAQLRDLGVGVAYAEEREQQNVTVALVMDGDRSFTTFGTPDVPVPPSDLPAPTLLFASLPYLATASKTVRAWREQGTIVIADAAWDDSGEWAARDLEPLHLAHVFVPNEVEAMNYTRKTSAEAAASALLAWCANVVVTTGADGAVIADAGGTRTIGGVRVDAMDPTGAGDAFSAGLGAGLCVGLNIDDAVSLGTLAGAWTVSRIGGSTSAPTIGELETWARELGSPYIDVVHAYRGGSVHKHLL